MKRKQFLLVGALILVSMLVSGIALAQDSRQQSPPDFAEALTTVFAYQGRLDKDSSPVNDVCDMNFRLYDAASMGTEVGSDFHAGVPVADGLFSVNLDFGVDAFTGDRRWLEIKVDCEEDGSFADLGRQELTATPYALSLRPGAVISGTNASGAILHVENTGGGISSAVYVKSGSGYAVQAWSQDNVGVYANSESDYGVDGRSTDSYGVHGESKTSYGVYAAGAGGDLGLYNGSVYAVRESDSDMMLYSNDNVDVYLDDDGNSTAQFRIFNGVSTPVFTATETGAIQSITDTQIAVSPLKMVGRYDAGNLEFRPQGYSMEVRTSSASVTSSAYVPVDLPSVLFGTRVKLKSIRVCYQCSNSASYISSTRVGRAYDSGGYNELITDTTDRDSTTWDCYTITDTTPAEIQGSLFVIVSMYFAGTGSPHSIQIGNITLTLTEQ
ncbi:MAG: hypothetical protein AB8I69_11375 [Anaerolineae bacterium]|jgi:hypothetical protein